jgi:hypothetical protein
MINVSFSEGSDKDTPLEKMRMFEFFFDEKDFVRYLCVVGTLD